MTQVTDIQTAMHRHRLVAWHSW